MSRKSRAGNCLWLANCNLCKQIIVVITISLLPIQIQAFAPVQLLGFTSISASCSSSTTSIRMATSTDSLTSLSTAKSESAKSKTTNNTPNWRVIRKDDITDDNSAAAGDLLNLRPAWSETAYQEALDLYQQLTFTNNNNNNNNAIDTNNDDSDADAYISGPIRQALNHLDHAYRLYGPESVICSFNGGKDAVVILHLVRAALANYYYQQTQQQQAETKSSSESATTTPASSLLLLCRPRVIYFDSKDEFPEIRQFLHDSVDMYDLDMIAFEQGIGFSQGLNTIVQHNRIIVPNGDSDSKENNSTIQLPVAFVLGTRQSDPNARGQGHFAPSSHYMPPFMRVNPVLDWTYGHVWHCLRLFHLPYCKLYDLGYTSLGSTKDTVPCPALAILSSSTSDNDNHDNNADRSGDRKYWPAYMLRDWDQERAGRIPKDKLLKSNNTTNINNSSNANLNASTTVLDETTSVTSRATQLSGMTVIPGVDNSSNYTTNGSVPQEVVGNTLLLDDHSVVSYTNTTNLMQRTVGVLVIGDEILKGLTGDSNTLAAAKALRENNVLLKRVVVVSDDLEQIVQEIHRMQTLVDVIITSGGVGPTHDDVTMKSVAAALDCEMAFHEEMAQLLKDKMSSNTNKDDDDNGGPPTTAAANELSEAQMKMAFLPQKAKLRYLSENPEDWPVLQCRNIFILPGVPDFFESKIESVARYLSCQLERSVSHKVVLSADELSIVNALNEIVERHPNVSFGSYPFLDQSFKTVITLEAKMMGMEQGNRSNSVIFDNKKLILTAQRQKMDQRVKAALDELINTLPEGCVLRVENDDSLLFN